MNPVTVNYLNIFLGGGAIALQFFFILALFFLFFGSKKNLFLDFLDEHYLIIGFIISLLASLFSLVYSEIIGFPPCELCWYQRIFLFPQVFLFGVALWEKNKSIIHYALPLLCVGFFISVYQNFIYYFSESSNLPCDASGISCYKQYISEFGGYISIPMLALTSFFALTALLTIVHFYKKRKLIYVSK